jgi:cyclophilin family peptidyl-prolyl cis-trans isomerase/HEAT repeat protein
MTDSRRTRCAPQLLFAAWLGLAACSHTGARAIDRDPGGSLAEQLAQVADCEARRDDGDGQLEALALRGEPGARRAALRALGRLAGHEPAERVLEALSAACADPVAAVRAEAAFALGLHGSVEGLAPLERLAADPDTGVRARAIAALSRIPDTRARALVAAALRDPAPEARRAAAEGLARFDPGADDFAAHATALAGALAAAEDDPEDLWRLLHAHARWKTGALRSECVAAAAHPDARVRIHAVQGLATGAHDAGSRDALSRALADADPRVAQEAALAARANPDAALVDALLGACAASQSSTRASALEALGALGARLPAPLDDEGSEDEDGEASPAPTRARLEAALDKARLDASPTVRGARLEALARMSGDESAPALDLARLDPDPVVRAAAARAAALLGPTRGTALATRLAADANLRVATTAAESLGAWSSDEARAAATKLLGHPDPGVRLATMGALAKIADSADEGAILACATTTPGAIGAEVAQVALDCAAKLGSRRIAERLATHPNDFVARKAARLLRERFGVVAAPDRVREAWRGKITELDLPRGARILTNRGVLELVLHGDESPMHVHNFAMLAGSGAYDGLTFHRVVPDFVVQGGDPRGDGNGGAAWDGGTLRAEPVPRPFVAGSLGMPRNDDPDSGGGQIFLTLRETPHLDWRYANFGSLVDGFDVLQELEVADRILRVELLR